jgi:hypothetical protein
MNSSLLVQHEVLVLGLHLVEHPVDLIGHAEAMAVEQRLGNPAFHPHPHEQTAGREPGRHQFATAKTQ